MERVAFLLEDTNTRLSAMLNPESVSQRRQSGAKLLSQARGTLEGPADSVQSAVSSAGGITELELALLFDTGLSGSNLRSRDVRDHTRPIWNLAQVVDGPSGRLPRLRFVWGKSWNVRAIVLDVAEKLEEFDTLGRPRRSWMRLRLMEISDAPRSQKRSGSARSGTRAAQLAATPRSSATVRTHVAAPAPNASSPFSIDRVDELAQRYYGDPGLWRLIARANGLKDPSKIPPGQVLTIPDEAR